LGNHPEIEIIGEPMSAPLNPQPSGG